MFCQSYTQATAYFAFKERTVEHEIHLTVGCNTSSTVFEIECFDPI